jgi:DnaJ-class molecular chaperone
VSLYRCAECGHGENLTAYSSAIAFGPLNADGLLTHHDDVSDDHVFESSIACTLHMDAVIERRLGDGYAQYLACPTCEGTGKRPDAPWVVCETCDGDKAFWRVPTAEVPA